MAIHNVKSEIETGKSAKQIFSDNFNSEHQPRETQSMLKTLNI